MFRKPSTSEVAERIFSLEMEKGGGAAGAAFRGMCLKFEDAMSSVLGEAGYQAMLRRSARKAIADPRFAGRRAMHDASMRDAPLHDAKTALEVLIALPDTGDAELVRTMGVALFAHFIELLTTLIGSTLTMKLLDRQWPEGLTNRGDGA